MERGRFSKEYAQFLCDRFYRRYRKTCYVKLSCTGYGCNEFTPLRASTPEPEQNMLMNTFKCKKCISTEIKMTKIKIQCTSFGCTHYVEVRADSAPIYLQNMTRTYICEDCEYCESSMDERD